MLCDIDQHKTYEAWDLIRVTCHVEGGGVWRGYPRITIVIKFYMVVTLTYFIIF